MTSTVVYKGDLSTELVHLKSQSVVVTDAPVDNKGKGNAFSPTDLMATSLASCMLTIMGIAAQEHDINIEGTKAEVTKIMTTEGPRKIKQIIINVFLPKLNFSLKEKKIISKAAESCPVARSLHPELIQTITLHWDES